MIIIMEKNAEDIIPYRATHPGSILRRELEARGIKRKDFAQLLGIPVSNLNAYITGKRNFSDAFAIKLEALLGISFQSWMNLQSRFNHVSRAIEERSALE